MEAVNKVYGIYQDPPFSVNWKWKCRCGATGGPVTDREQVRELWKEHRSACISFQPEGQAMTTEAKETSATPPSKPEAKKKASGKKTPDAGKKKREQSISEAQVKAALERLKKGDTSLLAESKKLGFTHNGPLRAALRTLIGRPAYDKLMSGSKKPAEKAKGGKKKAEKVVETAPATETTAEAQS